MKIFEDFELDLTKITKGGVAPLNIGCEEAGDGSLSGGGLSGNLPILPSDATPIATQARCTERCPSNNIYCQTLEGSKCC